MAYERDATHIRFPQLGIKRHVCGRNGIIFTAWQLTPGRSPGFHWGQGEFSRPAMKISQSQHGAMTVI